MPGIDHEKQQPRGLNVYGYQDSTSPGVALAAAEIAVQRAWLPKG